MRITEEELKVIIERELEHVVSEQNKTNDESELEEGAYDWMPFGSTASKMQKAVEKSRIENFPTSAEKATQSAEGGIDALLASFKKGLLKILEPQMAESADEGVEEEVVEETQEDKE